MVEDVLKGDVIVTSGSNEHRRFVEFKRYRHIKCFDCKNTEFVIVVSAHGRRGLELQFRPPMVSSLTERVGEKGENKAVSQFRRRG